MRKFCKDALKYYMIKAAFVVDNRVLFINALIKPYNLAVVFDAFFVLLHAQM